MIKSTTWWSSKCSITLILVSILSTSEPRVSMTCSPCSSRNFSISATVVKLCTSCDREGTRYLKHYPSPTLHPGLTVRRFVRKWSKHLASFPGYWSTRFIFASGWGLGWDEAQMSYDEKDHRTLYCLASLLFSAWGLLKENLTRLCNVPLMHPPGSFGQREPSLPTCHQSWPRPWTLPSQPLRGWGKCDPSQVLFSSVIRNGRRQKCVALLLRNEANPEHNCCYAGMQFYY